MPTASVGAAAARRDAGLADVPGVCSISSGVIVKPQFEITCAACAAVVPIAAAGGSRGMPGRARAPP
jgi:hypothetical protein